MIKPILDHGQRMGDHSNARRMFLYILRLRITHQPPATDEFHAGQIGEEMAHGNF
jgi:hypothetical protein